MPGVPAASVPALREGEDGAGDVAAPATPTPTGPKTLNIVTNGKKDDDAEKATANGGTTPTKKSGANGVSNGAKTPETYEAVGEDESPRSPIRKAHKRVSSRSLHNAATKQEQQKAHDEKPSPKAKPTWLSLDSYKGQPEAEGNTVVAETSEPNGSTTTSTAEKSGQKGDADAVADESKAEDGQLIYENFRNKSGENLASIKPSDDYRLSMQQHENKAKTSAPPGEAAKTRRQLHQRTESELVSGRRAGAGWSQSAIRWAPLNIPLQRRLQTFIVLLHTLSIAGGLALFFLLCTIPLLWPILLPYLIYVLLSRASVSGELSHRSDWLRRSKIWSLFAGYFPARLHRSTPLEPTRKYIFGYHPHGIISHGAFAAFGTEALGFSSLFPGITNALLTLDNNFRIPLYRDYALRMGLASVSRESCENILSRGGPNGEGMGRAITIVVGGARESLDAKPYTLRLVLKRRKGFVKLAIRTGADLVPVLAFGENDLYDQFDAATHPRVHRAQLFVKKVLGFTIPLFHARGVFNYDVGLLPYRRPMNIVVGRPIKTVQAKAPDPAYVDRIHGEYVKELERIWEEWSDVFARGREGEMEVVE